MSAALHRTHVHAGPNQRAWIRRVLSLLLAVTATALGSEQLAAAADPARLVAPRLKFQASSDSEVRLAGRATIGRWEVETNEIIAVIEPGPQLEALARRIRSGTDDELSRAAWGIPSLNMEATEAPHALITIPVASLRGGKPGMRADILRALRHEDAPLIVFSLGEIIDVRVWPRRPEELGRYHITARGDLFLAGQSRTIEMAAEVVQETAARFRIRATKALRLSDFGITPPTAMLGLIKVEDSVTVAFDLVFEAAGAFPVPDVADTSSTLQPRSAHKFRSRHGE